MHHMKYLVDLCSLDVTEGQFGISLSYIISALFGSSFWSYEVCFVKTVKTRLNVVEHIPLCVPLLHQFHSGTNSSISDSPIPSSITSSSSGSPLCSSITPSLFHFWLKTYLFYKSSPPHSFTSLFHFFPQTAFTDYHLAHFFWATRFLFLVFLYFCLFFMPCTRLSWPSCHILSARKYTVLYRIIYELTNPNPNFHKFNRFVSGLLFTYSQN